MPTHPPNPTPRDLPPLDPHRPPPAELARMLQSGSLGRLILRSARRAAAEHTARSIAASLAAQEAGR